MAKHDAATHSRRFNALFATASINDAIEYYRLFKRTQAKLQQENAEFEPLNIACVFSPPAEGNKDVQQMQEDLWQERMDNMHDPAGKKRALKAIIREYNQQYGTNHILDEFDGYYQDIQQRIKDQQYSNKDYAHRNKVDVTIVVDMLLTGFDSKYLNTLYVDKNLKYHGLIQAFSRTNRILNDTKPYGNVLDFRGQQEAVDKAIVLFSDEKKERSKEIWLVDPAPVVVEKYKEAVVELEKFMQSHGLACKAEEVCNLKGDEARAGFIGCFKEVQRLRTKLDQYTDLNEESRQRIENLLPDESLRAFRGAYIETVKQLREKREKADGGVSPEIDDLDFELVLFASSVIDYDYIMGLIAKYAGREPAKRRVTKEQLINLVMSSADLIEEREDIMEYINSLDEVNGMTVEEVKQGFEEFKRNKYDREIAKVAENHGLEADALKSFVKEIMDRMIFDGEKLSDLLAPLDLGWKARTRKELVLMEDLIPLLRRLAAGHEISGLSAYEE
nr:hypothetical protein [Odoribacter sp. Z80]